MATRKSIRAPKARDRKTTERPVTPLEQAEAQLYLRERDALIKPGATNPFVQETGSSDTVHYVACGLEYLSQLSLKGSGITVNDDIEMGQFLIVRTMVGALKTVQVQMENEHKVAYARGMVEVAKARDGAK